ncbi:MAG: DotI/IcmL/TraM family protein [Pseudomonadota bacterium]|jgi:hypothetical protein|nr:hypothetical protein [Pseudomonadota bacterium]QKK06067.1 MAG: DotI/IcmL/TraM family protein [Pseudomonadota bacterium]
MTFLKTSLFALLACCVFFTQPANAQNPYADKIVAPNMKRDLTGKSLAQGLLDDNFIKGWASFAVTMTYNFGYNNYQQQLEASAKHFTPEGWKNFLAALDEAKILEFVIKNKQFVATMLIGEPIITHQGVNNENGLYTWEVTLPVETVYSNRIDLQKMNLDITLIIVRTADKGNESGIGIQQWIAAVAPEVGPSAPAPDAAH